MNPSRKRTRRISLLSDDEDYLVDLLGPAPGPSLKPAARPRPRSRLEIRNGAMTVAPIADVDPLGWARPASPAEGDVPTQHGRYYIDDQCVVLQVEQKLFKVHRYFLRRESVVFRDMLTLPPASGSDGLDDAHPMVLEGVTIKEMEALLNYFYHGMDDTRKPSLDEWIALLSITHRFQFKDLCKRAVNAIDTASPPLDAVKKVLLGRRLGIQRLEVSGYVQLCQQKVFVTAQEGELLGGGTTALLGQARERQQRMKAGYHGQVVDSVDKIVREIFGL